MRQGLPASLRLVANGEIWSVADALRCRVVSGCDDLMIGRGMVADPGLALAIRSGGAVAWREIVPLLDDFWRQVSARVVPRHRAGRLKQWLGALCRRYPEAQQAFDELRPLHDPVAIERWLQQRQPTEPPDLDQTPPTPHLAPALPAGLALAC